MARAPAPGRFITLEGGEGAGKSVQARRLAARLSEAGLTVVLTREPGGSPGAEALREVILSGGAARYGAIGEAILFSAARIDHIDATIAPALKRGEWVVSDRFLDSTRAYQGAAGRLDPELVASLERVAVGLCRPTSPWCSTCRPARVLRAPRRDAAKRPPTVSKGRGWSFTKRSGAHFWRSSKPSRSAAR